MPSYSIMHSQTFHNKVSLLSNTYMYMYTTFKWPIKTATNMKREAKYFVLFSLFSYDHWINTASSGNYTCISHLTFTLYTSTTLLYITSNNHSKLRTAEPNLFTPPIIIFHFLLQKKHACKLIHHHTYLQMNQKRLHYLNVSICKFEKKKVIWMHIDINKWHMELLDSLALVTVKLNTTHIHKY